MEAGEEWRLAEMPVVITSRCGTSRAISIPVLVWCFQQRRALIRSGPRDKTEKMQGRRAGVTFGRRTHEQDRCACFAPATSLERNPTILQAAARKRFAAAELTLLFVVGTVT